MYSRTPSKTHFIAASLALVCALFINTHAQAEWLVEPEIDGGSLKLSDDFEFSPGDDTQSNLAAIAFGVQGGYLFSNHFFIKTGITSGGTENLLGWNDRIKFFDSHLSVGIDWPISDSFSAAGSVGISNWDYVIKNNNFLKENQPEKKVSGSGVQYRLGLNYWASDSISIGLHFGEKDWGEDVKYRQYGISLAVYFE